jgi:hypothetical protein
MVTNNHGATAVHGFTTALEPAPALDNGLLQLTPEHAAASWVSAQTPGGLAETH